MLIQKLSKVSENGEEAKQCHLTTVKTIFSTQDKNIYENGFFVL